MKQAVAKLIAREGQKVVVGLGKTGLSCVRFLVNKGYSVAVVDSREEPPGQSQLEQEFPEVSLYCGGLDSDAILNAAEVIVSPGVSIKQEPFITAASNGVSLIGDVELFCREVSAPIVAITGSNAKSTVTDLVGKMAAAAKVNVSVGGNIGTPVLELLAQPEAELYVLELSSFQLETTQTLRAKVATVLNVSEDHMDRYQGIADYRLAKHRIYRGCEQVVFNREDPLTAALVPQEVKQVSFGLNKPDLKDWGLLVETQTGGEETVYLAQGLTPVLDIKELKMRGSHNYANALAALALGSAVGLPLDAMLEALKSYRGLPHRCEWIGDHDGVQWFNDSKGTNVGATVAAVQGLATAGEKNLVLIAGGVGKGADFAPLKPVLQKSVKQVFLFGEDKQVIADALGSEIAIELVTDLEQAVGLAQSSAQTGDVVLFSPACASFDMFANYEERGEVFCELVNKLSSNN